MSYQDIWITYYYHVYEEPYYMNAKEATCLKRLRERIIWYLTEKGFTPLSDEVINDQLERFLYKITDKFTLESLNPSMVLNQWNILIAQASGKTVKNKEQIYRPIKTNDKEHEKERLAIIEGYKRVSKEPRQTLGDKARLALGGTKDTSATTGAMVKTVIREYKKD